MYEISSVFIFLLFLRYSFCIYIDTHSRLYIIELEELILACRQFKF